MAIPGYRKHERASRVAETHAGNRMDLTLANFAIAAAAVIFAGISKGGFGNGAGFAVTPLLALVLGPAEAIALMLPLLMIMDAAALRAWWGQWDRQAARVMILGGAIGVAIGAAVFSMISPALMRLMMGIVALLFVAVQLAQRFLGLRLRRQAAGRREGVFWGAVSGLTSFISHAGGPPAAVYLLSRSLSKATYQATSVLVFSAINAMKFVCYLWLGFFGQTTALAVVALSPMAILGVALGVWAHRRVPEGPFFAAIYIMLTVTGARLVWGALG